MAISTASTASPPLFKNVIADFAALEKCQLVFPSIMTRCFDCYESKSSGQRKEQQQLTQRMPVDGPLRFERYDILHQREQRLHRCLHLACGVGRAWFSSEGLWIRRGQAASDSPGANLTLLFRKSWSDSSIEACEGGDEGSPLWIEGNTICRWPGTCFLEFLEVPVSRLTPRSWKRN